MIYFFVNIFKINSYSYIFFCLTCRDGDVPHPAIGNSRWMPVGRRNLQHEIMLEAVENQSPDVVIVDEISNQDEVHAAQTIAQRGIMLIATVHGNTLAELIRDRERGALVGGCSTVTLSGKEADRRSDKSKQVLKRSKEPVFQAALELHSRSSWIFHDNIKDSVDSYLEKEPLSVVRLCPGKALQCSALPEEGRFEYCDECNEQSICMNHQLGTSSSNPFGKENNNNSVQNNSNMPFAATKSRNRNRRRRKGNGNSQQYTM